MIVDGLIAVGIIGWFIGLCFFMLADLENLRRQFDRERRVNGRPLRGLPAPSRLYDQEREWTLARSNGDEAA